jgi:3-hydroxyacyl-CoA dehydrogenase/enoyl-CoA hydratase/3-hydroxybutyryl-CoA epimerase
MQYTIDEKGVAYLVIDTPGQKANIINIPFLQELSDVLDALEKQAPKALVIKSAKSGIFIAGADLHGFKPVFKDPPLAKKLIGMGHAIFKRLANAPFATIAAIDGACLGGGCELALGCQYRIASDSAKTQIGLPEVNLGLFPGWGGTQRAPRLVGLIQGMNLVLSGKPVDAKKAYKIHLIDAIAPAEFFQEHLNQFIDKVLTKRGKEEILAKRKKPLFDKTLIGPLVAFWSAKRNIQKKTKGLYTAPFAALNVIKKGFFMPLDRALAYEADSFLKGISTDLAQAVNLIQLFFNNEALKKNPGVPEGAKPVDVEALGVIGAGTMGSGISFSASYRDIPTRFKDISWQMVANGYGAAWKSYETLIKIRKLFPNQASLKFHKMSGTVTYDGFSKLPLVVEAATENLDLKFKIFHELEAILPKEAIIASNTSSLAISELASKAKHPERFVGMHFFNPVARMPLVEVVAGEKTSADTLATAVAFCQKLKKTPIVVKDCAGFLVNRIFVMGIVETMAMVEEGISQEQIGRALLNFGMPMDPFELADEVGNDVNYKVLESFSKAYPDRVYVSKIVKQVFDAGFFGKKVDKGFYLYAKRKKRGPNPEVLKWLPKDKKSVKDATIVDRLTLAMLAESARCLEEKIVTEPGHLDMALVLGTGFPPFRTGILRYADDLGIKQCVEKMEILQKEYGARFAPCPLLQQMAKEGRGFYP